MKRRIDILSNIDWFTVLLYLIMVIMGWLNIYAAVYNEDHSSIFDFSQRYGRQLIWIIVALIFASAVLLIEGQFFNIFGNIFYGVFIFMLIMVLLVGKEINGAKSWFVIGPVQFQPAEFAKIGAVLAVAKYLGGFNANIRNMKTLATSIGLIFLPIILILLQPDGGSAIVFVALTFMLYREGMPDWIMLLGVYLIMLSILPLIYNQLFIITFAFAVASLVYWFISRRSEHFAIVAFVFAAFYGLAKLATNYIVSLPHFNVLLIAGTLLMALVYLVLGLRKRIRRIAIVVLFYFVSVIYIFSFSYVFDNFLSDYQQRRIKIVLGLEEDPMGYGYNVEQSKIAIGSGGFTGKGYLQGTQTKLRFVPEQSTDFIFCTVGEEWGWIGTFTVMLLFIILLLRIIYIAERQRLKFSRIYAYGVVSVLFFHVLINVGMTIGLMPVIGIPLPFFSYGGSSLWAFTILLFIMLRLDAERSLYLR